MNALIFTLNKYRYSNYLRRTSHKFMEFIGDFERTLNLPDKIAFFPNTTTAMGGTLNFAMQMGTLRNDIAEAMEWVRGKHEKAKILYESWKDGIEER